MRIRKLTISDFDELKSILNRFKFKSELRIKYKDYRFVIRAREEKVFAYLLVQDMQANNFMTEYGADGVTLSKNADDIVGYLKSKVEMYEETMKEKEKAKELRKDDIDIFLSQFMEGYIWGYRNYGIYDIKNQNGKLLKNYHLIAVFNDSNEEYYMFMKIWNNTLYIIPSIYSNKVIRIGINKRFNKEFHENYFRRYFLEYIAPRMYNVANRKDHTFCEVKQTFTPQNITYELLEILKNQHTWWDNGLEYANPEAFYYHPAAIIIGQHENFKTVWEKYKDKLLNSLDFTIYAINREEVSTIDWLRDNKMFELVTALFLFASDYYDIWSKDIPKIVIDRAINQYSRILAQFSNDKIFKLWWNPEAFDWNKLTYLALYQKENFNLWYNRDKIPATHYDRLIKYLPDKVDIWWDDKKIEKLNDFANNGKLSRSIARELVRDILIYFYDNGLNYYYKKAKKILKIQFKDRIKQVENLIKYYTEKQK